MEKEIFNQIYNKHKNKLKYLTNKNENRLVIAFAGVPGSGKTAISKLLEDKFKAVRINSLDVQNLLEDIKNEKVYEGVILDKREYIMWLMSKIAREGSNKLIILDKAIDRTYDDVYKWAKENNYHSFVVSLTGDARVFKGRIIKREGDNAVNYLKDFYRQWKEFLDFQEHHKADVIIDSSKLTPEECLERVIPLL